MPLQTLLVKGSICEAPNAIPVDYIMSRISQMYSSTPATMADKVLILVSGTGSGKSTIIPPEIYIRYHAKMGRLIMNTQPRQISAIRTVQQDIMRWYSKHFKLGENLGYQTSSFSKRVRTGVVYATVGTLLQQLKLMTDEAFMRKYSVIMIDEAHERSQETDLTILFLKKYLERNWKEPKCPLVLFMSATLDVDVFYQYFENPRVIKVLGYGAYPIEQNWLQAPVSSTKDEIINRVKKLHDNKSDYESSFRDILIFTWGGKALEDLATELNDYAMELPKDNKFIVIKLTSPIYAAGGEDAKALEADLEDLRVDNVAPKRKVIIATPVAETSLTIESLKYVIDDGTRLAVEFDPIIESNISLVKPISQDMALQRKGRVGRKSPGIWYPIYDEKLFGKLDVAKFPDMITSDPTAAIMALIAAEEVWNGDIPIMGGLSQAAVQYSIQKLFYMGAISATESGISATDVGRLMNMMRKIKLENARMIVAGYAYGANVSDLLSMAAMIESAPWGRKYERRQIVADPALDAYLADRFIDCIILFNEFRKICEGPYDAIEKWCDETGVSFKGMMSAATLRDEWIGDMVYVVGLDPSYVGIKVPASEYNLADLLRDNLDIGMDEIVKLKHCIAAGYRMNIATWDAKQEAYFAPKCPLPVNIPIDARARDYYRDPGSGSGRVKFYCPPRQIIYSSITYSNTFKPRVDAALWSPLDSFVVIER